MTRVLQKLAWEVRKMVAEGAGRGGSELPGVGAGGAGGLLGRSRSWMGEDRVGGKIAAAAALREGRGVEWAVSVQGREL